MTATIKVLKGFYAESEVDGIISASGDHAIFFFGNEAVDLYDGDFKVLANHDIPVKTSEHLKECQAEKIRKITGLPCKKIHLSLTFE